MISPQTATLISAFKDPILKILTDFKDEVSHFIDNGLTDYVDNYNNKYSKTKTFLFRDEKVNFYDIYFPISIKGKKLRLDSFEQIEDLFNERQYVSIIGTAGSGKSMLLKHLFLSAIKDLFKIPLIIELRHLNDFNGSITEYIYKNLFKNKLAPNDNILERILMSGNFLFLLDGYDEIFSDQKNKISNDIEEFIDLYSKNTFIITSRPGSNVEALQRFDNFHVEPLSPSQIKDFVQLQLKVSENTEGIQRIMTVIGKPENKDYRAYLSSPLLLSMFIFTFNSYPELPRSKSRFYWNVFDTLCTKHDSFTKKGCWQHERKSNLQNEELESILKWFSFKSIFSGKYSFDSKYLAETLTEIKNKLNLDCNINDLINDLAVSISILIIDGTEYTFPHKSLQEYFSALLIKDLSVTQKEKVYNERFSNLERSTHGGNQNLYNLCFEIDRLSFSEFFVLFNLKKIIQNIDLTDRESTILSFLNYFGYYHGFSLDVASNTYILNAYSYSASTNIELLEYLISTTDDLFNIDSKLSFTNEDIEKLIGLGYTKNEKNEEGPPSLNNLLWIDYVRFWSSEIYDFVMKIGLGDYICNLVSEVNSQIEKTELDILTERKNLDSLIDF